ncbi:M48 family metallopeptidase [Nocardiopsis sp. MG754419]|uniref:M48 family metallopeptidase n=1 Tax=Nocardiopsis sp. MG754419 TaxID=2259865 RepID=UPI001BA99097|nr:M48 family metallopeptidase [Nocardiopsis sp. MG754419]MBR8744564.1 peptidase M48 [Nocardiopsis sp. MG754419]
MHHATPTGGTVPACSVHTIAGRASASRTHHAPRSAPLNGYVQEPCPEDAGDHVVLADRHPWESPLFALCAAVSAVVVGALLHLVWSVSGSPTWTAAALGAVPLVCWWVRGLGYARERAESPRISPTQFPEAYRIVVSLAGEMGLTRPPEAYVRFGEPSPRADAAGHGLRRYLILPGSLFDENGRPRDPDATAFLVAHQIGHIAAGHTGFWQRLATLGAELVPGLGASLARTREYTADNHGLAHVPEGAHAVRLFAGGSHLYLRVNLGEMAARASVDRDPTLLVYHLLSRRPGNARRMAALRDRSRRGRVII